MSKPVKYFDSLTPSECGVYLACAQLVVEGVWPGPKALVNLLHGHDGHMLNGRECAVRRKFFELNGFKKDPNTGRWYHPTKVFWRRWKSTPTVIVGPETKLVGDPRAVVGST